jgi:hypothetical protein
MPRWTLLRHDLPDGTSHLDWLIERRDGDAGLLTFRLPIPPDWPGLLAACLASPGRGACAEVAAAALPDHRREYLAYEGEVSGNRGRVRRLAEGVGRIAVLEEAVLIMSIRWEDCEIEVEGLREADGSWKLRARYAASAEG